MLICSSYHRGPLDSSEVSGEREFHLLKLGLQHDLLTGKD